MTREKYVDIVQGILLNAESIAASVDKISSPAKRPFMTCMANLEKFYPDYDVKDDKEFYKEVLFYQDWATLDQSVPFARERTKIKGELTDMVSSAKIYCTFHIGSHRLLNHFLLENNIDFALLVRDEIYDEVKDVFKDLHQQFCLENGHDTQFEILSAGKPDILFKMIKALRSGKSIVVYLDGNSGVGGNRKDEKVIPIRFMNQTILARKGLAFLSHLLNIPIVPVVSYRKKFLNFVLEFLNPMPPRLNESREEYSISATKELYGQFEKFIYKYPKQWDGWMYFHYFLAQQEEVLIEQSDITTGVYHFNNTRFDFYQEGSSTFLFDLKNYFSFAMPEGLSTYLVQSRYVTATCDEWKSLFPEDFFINLVQKRVFVPQIRA